MYSIDTTAVLGLFLIAMACGEGMDRMHSFLNRMYNLMISIKSPEVDDVVIYVLQTYACNHHLPGCTQKLFFHVRHKLG